MVKKLLAALNHPLFATLALGLAWFLGYLGPLTPDTGIPIFLFGILLGQGIVPAAGVVATELTAVTRRAFVPKGVVQLYNSSPTIASLLANAQPAYGGVSSVSVPVQGTSMVSGGFIDYSGNFSAPGNQPGMQLTEQNLKVFAVPIPFGIMEGLVQMDHAIIPLIEARMNDATNFTMDAWSTAIFGNTTNFQAFIGLPGAIDDGTNMVNYGNLNRNTNPFWQSKVYAAGAQNPTRQLILQYLAGATKNGAEMPTFGVTGFGTWTLLAQDFVGQESYQITPGTQFDDDPEGPRSGFRALMVGGVPIYADPYCPEGTMYLVNSNYINFYVHVAANFAFTGFESTVSNFQLGYVGVLLTVAELVSVKPKTMARIAGFNSLTL